jgi:hypothetical protein
MRTSRTDEKGEKTESGMLDSANKSLALLSNEEVLGAEIELNRRSAERSGDSNPLYDDSLTPEQRSRVLTYRSMKVNNAAKQNYTKNGESAFISLGLDEPWYQDFKDKENAFYAKVLDKKNNDSIKTFSGKPTPKASPELESKLDFYYTLPKGTGDRSRFLQANPDVLSHWNAQNDFTNEERTALGFNKLTEDDSKGRGFGFGGGGGPKDQRQYLSTLLSGGLQLAETPQIKTTPTRFKLKVQKPTKGRKARIRLG